MSQSFDPHSQRQPEPDRGTPCAQSAFVSPNLERLFHPDTETRRYASLAMVAAGSDQAIASALPTLSNALIRDADPAVRKNIAQVLGNAASLGELAVPNVTSLDP